MKLSISNIAWSKEYDSQMYEFISQNGFEGLEIAPTRIFPESPYDKISEAKEFKKMLFENYGLNIPSMQSIWYGRTEQVFGEEKERETLIEYTKKTFAFAQELGCNNLVFGCPKNRSIRNSDDIKIAKDFFNQLGELAASFGTTLALEANPEIYGTNFLNATKDAFDFASSLGNKSIKVNYDLGTVIYNKEDVEEIKKYLPFINHIHISEPNLNAIEFGEMHKTLLKILREENWNGYVSIEMKNLGDLELVKSKVLKLQNLRSCL